MNCIMKGYAFLITVSVVFFSSTYVGCFPVRFLKGTLKLLESKVGAFLDDACLRNPWTAASTLLLILQSAKRVQLRSSQFITYNDK